MSDIDKRKGPRGELLPIENRGLPDSRRPNGLCPRCGKQSSFVTKGSLSVTFDYEHAAVLHAGVPHQDALDRVMVLVCRNCRQGTAVIEEMWSGDTPRREGIGGGTVHYRGFYWWPLPETQLSSDIPPDIADAFAEAATALAAGCPRASAVMSRRTLEAITVDKGETVGTLANRLTALSSKNILLPTLSEWAKEIRLVGNTGGHYDPMEHVSKDDAQQLLSFLRELMQYLYEFPADLARRRSKGSTP